MRKCKICGEEKDLEDFRKRQIWRSHTCKKCYSAKYASGKENAGRFKKGIASCRKGKFGIQKRSAPRYVKKGREPKSEHRLGLKSQQWSLRIKERDGWKCKVCAATKSLHAHHIVPWKLNKEKRFELENGICLCIKCHSTVERYGEMMRGKFNLPRTRS